jgi:hypothetical protein
LPPNAVQIPGDKVLQWLSSNRLSRLPIEVDRWQRRGLLLPKGAQLQFSTRTLDTMPQRGFSLKVPGVLEISVVVESRGSPGLGILPPAVEVGTEPVKHLGTYGIVARMLARFDWLSAASPEMPAYKEWVSFVFRRIEQLNSDDPSTEPIVVKAGGG